MGSMPNIHVRDVPPRVHQALKKRAEREGRSVNDVIVATLIRSYEEERERAKFVAELRRVQKMSPPPAPGEFDVVEVIRRDRDTDYGRL